MTGLATLGVRIQKNNAGRPRQLTTDNGRRTTAGYDLMRL
jgi:hypothetical protein